MTLEIAVAIAMFVGVLAYALFGGADFGSGFFDLTAGNSRAGAELRRQIDRSIGPVWEANHVWLIYILVMAWTGFPEAFAAVMNTLILPMLFALLGIVLRGSSFAFRKYSATLGQARLFGFLFATSSVATPMFLGAVAGAVASGRVPLEGRGDIWNSWLNPTSLLCGAAAVGTCAFLAGVFLTADAVRGERTDLAETLRRRTLAIGAITGALVLSALIPLHEDAPTLWSGLSGKALPLIATSACSGAATLALVAFRRPALARLTAVAAVGSVVTGWAVAQYPWLLVDQILIQDAGGAPATLQGLLVAVGLAAALVAPAMIYLYRLTQTDSWTR